MRCALRPGAHSAGSTKSLKNANILILFVKTLTRTGVLYTVPAVLPALDYSDLPLPHHARACWTDRVGSRKMDSDPQVVRYFVQIESRLRTRRFLSPATRLDLDCLFGASFHGLDKISYSPWGMSTART